MSTDKQETLRNICKIEFHVSVYMRVVIETVRVFCIVSGYFCSDNRRRKLGHISNSCLILQEEEDVGRGSHL